MKAALEAARKSHFALLLACAATAWLALPTPTEELAASALEFEGQCVGPIEDEVLNAASKLALGPGADEWLSGAPQQAPVQLTFADALAALDSSPDTARHVIAYLPEVAAGLKQTLTTDVREPNLELLARLEHPDGFCKGQAQVDVSQIASCRLDWILPAFNEGPFVETERTVREQQQELSALRDNLASLSGTSLGARREAEERYRMLGPLSKETLAAESLATTTKKVYRARRAVCNQLLHDHAQTLQTLHRQRPVKRDLGHTKWSARQLTGGDGSGRFRFITKAPTHLVAAVSCGASSKPVAATDPPVSDYYLALAVMPRVVPLGQATSDSTKGCQKLATRLKTTAKSVGLWQDLEDLSPPMAIREITGKARGELRSGTLFGIEIDRGSILDYAPFALLLMLCHLLVNVARVRRQWTSEDEAAQATFAWFGMDRSVLAVALTAASLLLVPWTSGWCGLVAARQAGVEGMKIEAVVASLPSPALLSSAMGSLLVPAWVLFRRDGASRRTIGLAVGALFLLVIWLLRGPDVQAPMTLLSNLPSWVVWITALNAAVALLTYHLVLDWRLRASANLDDDSVGVDGESVDLAQPTESGDAASKPMPPAVPDPTSRPPPITGTSQAQQLRPRRGTGSDGSSGDDAED